MVPKWTWSTLVVVVGILVVVGAYWQKGDEARKLVAKCEKYSGLPECRSIPTARAAEEKPVVWADPQQIKAPSHKWSDPYPVPSGKFGIAVQKGESAEVVFSDGGSDGGYYLLDNYKQVTFGKKSGTFRWRGIDREVVVYVYAAT